MLSEANIASWCSPARASPSYTPSRRRLRLRHWLLSEANLACTHPSRRNFSRRTCCWLYALQNSAPGTVQALRATELVALPQLAGLAGHGFYQARSGQGRFARHSTGCLPPPEMAESFEFYGEPVCGRHRAIGSFATRTRQPHRIRSTPSIKGLPHTAMLAAITDPLTVALGGAKPLPETASQWQGWCVTDLRTDGGWRRGSLVVNGDGLGAD